MPQNLPDTLLIKPVDTALELSSANFKEKPLSIVTKSHERIIDQPAFSFKRLLEVFFATAGLLLLSPLLIVVTIFTKLSSKGNIIYTQQRAGYKGELFTIYKFRSMYIDAEKNGPALSSETDKRVTKWGRIMRKWRIDELPQLWNIVKGEMSFVGPRPERIFYIKEIEKSTNGFTKLLSIKPGLTSWGMVQFGYASTVDEMIQRMQYDLEYLNNVSFLFNLKILLYSLRIIFLGKGR